ncbi:MAG: hypothetical protein LBC63_03170 [Holophagales bacterium]|jgi:predicted HicB family RNase H-like nuclease|nr:hypothetical protein [Holophagales bacterium]
MKRGTANHRGYSASIHYSREDGCFVGEALGLRRTSFDIRGATFEKACADFREWIDLYLANCENEGIEAEKPQGIHWDGR